MDFEQPVGDMDSEVGVDPDQMGVEGCVVEFRQRQAVLDDRRSKLLIRIHHDMGGKSRGRDFV